MNKALGSIPEQHKLGTVLHASNHVTWKSSVGELERPVSSLVTYQVQVCLPETVSKTKIKIKWE